jgi:transaldolase/glucose-6-phosphate isomerase
MIMAENPLQRLEGCGQSVWIDYIRRTFVQNGDLERLIKQDGVGGVTSNPTIFEKAIGGSNDYDQDLRRLVGEGASTEDIFRDLASFDVGAAADLLRPVYDRTNGHDGFISIEVSPEAAHDTEKTLSDAHWFWQQIDRPNLMIKVPATPEGIPAIEQLISEGINVNITLIFAVEVYEQVMEAYLKGLERRVQEGKEIGQIASVASFFVSRVDTLVDKLLEDKAKGADEGLTEKLHSLEGKAAVANAKIAYERFEQVFGSERFQRLAAKGAQVQRPLWASTSTKNPNFPDTLYVDSLVGKETVNTMPLQTLQAVRDHGRIECDAVTQDVPGAHQDVAELKSVGIDMTDVTSQLTVEGIKSFTDSLHKLFETIEQQRVLIQAGDVASQEANLDGQQGNVDGTLKDMASNNFLQRLWDKDPSLWKPASSDQSEITDRLGWLHVSDCMLEQKQEFADIAAYVRDRGFTHAVVLGMGGSSLAPYVFAESFGRQQGYPELLVLDSTDPEAVRAVEHAVDLTKTLFLVSTKSGGTTETLSFFKTFWEKVHGVAGDSAGDQFVAITDPGSSLETLAKQHGFHRCYLNPSDIGGRYSALSYFGLIPAAVMGIDVPHLLDRALSMEQACAASVPATENPGAWLGAAMANLAKTGHDKVTFFLGHEISSLGLWLEQLLAESTGKEGTGLVPVPDNPPGDPSDYGPDHLFVSITLKGSRDQQAESRVQALEKAGQPVVRLSMDDPYDLGPEFFRWEFATAVAGALLGINAFNQPNVQESKDNTKRLLHEYQEQGHLPEPRPLAASDGVTLFANDEARAQLNGETGDPEMVLQHLLGHVKAPNYLAIMAYLAPSEAHDAVLYPLRAEIRDACKVAVTLGYGPRFLHSTGQLHKGGPPEGVFLQVTAGTKHDVPVPGEAYSYSTLIAAQALGDFQSLQQHGRPALRVHLPDESDESMRRLQGLIRQALAQPSSAAKQT